MKANHTNSQNGQSLIIIALMIVGILGFLGLVLDGGQVFLTRRNSQDAADAAAFASVRVLATRSDNSPTTEQAIYNAALDYARVNQVITNTDVTVAYINQTGGQIRTINPASFGNVPDNPLATGVRVTATIRLQPYFIDLLIGNNPIPVPSVAAAQSGPPSIGSEVAPMTIQFPCTYNPQSQTQSCSMQYNHTYQIFGNSQLPGGFQWVDYSGGSSANDIVNYLNMTWTSGPILADRTDTYYNPSIPTQYNSPPPSPNPWVPSGPGVQPNNNISFALDCWLDPNIVGCWPQPGPKPTNRDWVVPIYDVDNAQTGSNAKYHVVMFGEFEFLGYWFANNQCNWFGAPSSKQNLCDNKPAGSLSPDLVPCLNTGQKCIIGQFKKEVQNLQIKPGVCNTFGLDVCGYGLSQ